MGYRILYEKKAIKSLEKIDLEQRKMIFAWINKNLSHTDNPKSLGKALKGSLKDYWRYRVGNYRIIADINSHDVTIIIFDVGHRSKIYLS